MLSGTGVDNESGYFFLSSINKQSQYLLLDFLSILLIKFPDNTDSLKAISPSSVHGTVAFKLSVL